MEAALPVAIAAVVAAMVVGMLAAVFGPGYLRAREERRVLAVGAPASAVILGLEDTGNRFNDTPEIVIRLRVTAPGRPAWEASVHRVLSSAEVQAFAPGRELAVRFDTVRPERIALAP